jgi:hypothetical protein
MGRPRKYTDPVEMTLRLERSLRDRLKRHVHGRLEMNATIERAVTEFLDRKETPVAPVVPVVPVAANDPNRNLLW